MPLARGFRRESDGSGYRVDSADPAPQGRGVYELRGGGKSQEGVGVVGEEDGVCVPIAVWDLRHVGNLNNRISGRTGSGLVP